MGDVPEIRIEASGAYVLVPPEIGRRCSKKPHAPKAAFSCPRGGQSDPSHKGRRMQIPARPDRASALTIMAATMSLFRAGQPKDGFELRRRRTRKMPRKAKVFQERLYRLLVVTAAGNERNLSETAAAVSRSLPSGHALAVRTATAASIGFVMCVLARR